MVHYYHKDFWNKNKKMFFNVGIVLIIISIMLLIYFDDGILLKTFFFTYLSLSIALIFPLVCTMKRFKFKKNTDK
jgi:hypothetical protein